MRCVLLPALLLAVVCSGARLVPHRGLQASTEPDELSRNASAVTASLSGSSATSPSLLPNQYISSYYNRYMSTDDVRRYTWFTPLFCASSHFWLNVTDVMHARQVEYPCVRVTCHLSGDVGVEALADCGDATPIVNHYGRDAPRGIRLLTTNDPLTQEQMLRVTPRKSLVADVHGRGFYAKAGNFMRIPKTDAWDLTRDASRCKPLHWPSHLPHVTDEASLKGCLAKGVEEKGPCLKKVDDAEKLGVDWYLKHKGRKTKIMLTKCEQWKNDQVMGLFSFGVKKSDCEKRIAEELSSMKKECSKYETYCNQALDCAKQAMLPEPRFRGR